ncbi:hypothetical protein LN893_18630 [Pontibacter sp. XAAS-A31]|nr:hypothetical protein [Pontibacter harenae]
MHIFAAAVARNVEFNDEVAIRKPMEVFWSKNYRDATMKRICIGAFKFILPR